MKPWLRHLLLLVALFAVTLTVGRRWLGRDRFRPPVAVVARGPQMEAVQAAAARIDGAFEAGWQRAGVTPVAVADELTVLRRLSLALTGTIPSVEEIRAYESGQAGATRDERIQWWVSHLLEDRRSGDYLAERFARVFVGVEDGPFVVYRRRRLVSWLAGEIRSNRRYDELVRTLITAEGIWTSRPEVNFVTVTVDQNNDQEGPDEQKLAGRVARAFLGVRLDCVQCHDDFLGGSWKQRDFHELAAFFACAEMSMTGLRDDARKEYEHRYLRKAEKEVVPPRVPFNAGLLPVEGPLRQRLATWVTHRDNRAFARTLANRVWALMFNRPLHSPVDDIPLDGPWPPALEVMADELVAGGYDLHRLVRVIAATRVFQTDSRGADEPVTEEQERLWAAFPLTRLRPEQVAGAVLQAASLRTIDADSPVLVRTIRYFQEKDFVRRFGDLGQDEFGPVAGTIAQRLVLMNGELVRERTKEDLLMNASTRIPAVSPEKGLSVEAAFLAVLTRRPGADERAHFLSRMEAAEGMSAAKRMQDLYWTLFNSTEFSWNH